MKKNKLAWWLKFTDGTVKKVFAENMREAWGRGEEIGQKINASPISVSGSKSLVNNPQTMQGKDTKTTSAADPKVLIEILKWMADPFALDPHAGDNENLLIDTMMSKAKEALEIVKSFPVVIIED